MQVGRGVSGGRGSCARVRAGGAGGAVRSACGRVPRSPATTAAHAPSGTGGSSVSATPHGRAKGMCRQLSVLNFRLRGNWSRKSVSC